MPTPSLLFDLDGTLTEPALGITQSIAFALQSLGHTPPPLDSLRWCIGPPLRISFPKLLNTTDSTLVEKAVALYRQRYSTLGLFECTLYPHIPEILQLLARSHRLFLATAKPAVYATRLLDHFQLTPLFAGIYGPELSGKFDDKSELLAHLLATENLLPQLCIMIGDRANDMLAATRNHVHPLGTLWGYGDSQELLSAGAKTLCTSVQSLPSTIQKINAILPVQSHPPSPAP